MIFFACLRNPDKLIHLLIFYIDKDIVFDCLLAFPRYNARSRFFLAQKRVVYSTKVHMSIYVRILYNIMYNKLFVCSVWLTAIMLLTLVGLRQGYLYTVICSCHPCISVR